MGGVWVTTVDNPFDPFTQWNRWRDFDERNGYRTCERVALLARDSTELSDAETKDSVVNAIVTLCEMFSPYEVYVLAIEGQTKPFGFV